MLLEGRNARHLRDRTSGARLCAFSITEILVVMTIIAVLIGLLLPALAKVRAAGRQTSCISNLRQIATSMQMYAHDNGLHLPDPTGMNKSWEQMLSPYIRGCFECPSDSEVAPVVGSSYDWRDTGDTTTTLAGKLITDAGRSNLVFIYEALPGWHARNRINIARLDSSVESINEDDCYSDLNTPNYLNSNSSSFSK